jgi:hypothetical protein
MLQYHQTNYTVLVSLETGLEVLVVLTEKMAIKLRVRTSTLPQQ